VGDAEFQKKCLGKMGEVAEGGRTVLFVSHNLSAVERLSKNTVWLEAGNIYDKGITKSIVNDYLIKGVGVLPRRIWEDNSSDFGNEFVRFREVYIQSIHGKISEKITIRTPLKLVFVFENLKPNIKINLSVHLTNEQGVLVLNSFPMNESNWFNRPHPIGIFQSTCYIPGDLLNDGMHFISVLVVKDQKIILFKAEDILSFNVLDSPERRPEWHGKWLGAIRPILRWETILIKQ
jgi:lipopolysaccharide transport system ATP-binding protein